MGGHNRQLAPTALAAEVASRLPDYDVITELDRIPVEFGVASVHVTPSTSRPTHGVQLELPPRVRGLSPLSPPPGDDGLSPPTRALIEALAAVAERWSASTRTGVIAAADAEAIAAAFGLGEVLDFDGPCDRGELGQVWRLSAGAGDWAVKESFEAGGVHDHVGDDGVP